MDQRDFPKLEEALKLTAETKLPPDSRDATVGFRVLLDLSGIAKPASASPASPP